MVMVMCGFLTSILVDKVQQGLIRVNETLMTLDISSWLVGDGDY